MKFVTCISGIALCIFMLQGSGGNVQSKITDEEFIAESENVAIKESTNYQIGDLDLRVNSENNCYYSRLKVKLSRPSRAPRAKITLRYTNNLGKLEYIFNNKDISSSYNSRFKQFTIAINLPLDKLAAQSEVTFIFDYSSKVDSTNITFHLSNPKLLIVGDDKPIKVYSRFYKPFAYTHGINYFKYVMAVPKNDYAYHEFYYDHFDINKNLALRPAIQYSISNLTLVFDNKNLDVYSDVTHRVNGQLPNFVHFNLLPIQRKTSYTVDLVTDGELYYEPTTNKMFSKQAPGLLKAENNFYMPKGYYETFKSFTFYLVFDFDIASLIFRIALKHTINFDDNVYGGSVLVTKTSEKTIEDNFGGN